MIIEECICGGREFEHGEKLGIDVAQCKSCGAMHQVLNMGLQEYSDWYADQYMESIYRHSYEEDRVAAEKRLVAYREILGGRVLDIGCGNGAFVEGARKRGYNVYGLDFHAPDKGVYYRGGLKEQNFPTGYFDIVTLHDVLEHVPDVLGFLKEVRRIVEDDGTIVIDFPAFWEPEGEKHWKPVEHLWFFTQEELEGLFFKFDLTVLDSYAPIPGKITYILQREPSERRSILVPPGIGDSFWSIAKIESLIEVEGLQEEPELQIVSFNQEMDRSFDFVKRFPFLKCTGYYRPDDNLKTKPIWRRAYRFNEDGTFRNKMGFDWFLSANGPFRHDRTLDEIMTDYQTNWYPPMFISAEERDMARAEAAAGDYVILFFTSAGPYKKWFNEYPASRIAGDLDIISRKGYRLIATGAAWDNEDEGYNEVIQNLRTNPMLEDRRGETTMDQFLALLRGASGTFGFCGGNTIFSTILHKPTVILWNDYYVRSFHRNSCPPDSPFYSPINTKDVRRTNPAMELLRLMKGARDA